MRTQRDVLRVRPGRSEHPAPEPQPDPRSGPHRTPSASPRSPKPSRVRSVVQTPTFPRAARCSIPARSGAAPHRTHSANAAAPLRPRETGRESRGGARAPGPARSCIPGAPPQPRRTSAPGRAQTAPLKRQRGAGGVRGGEGAQSPSGTGLGCRSCSVGEGNPGALRIGVVLCLLGFFCVGVFFPPFQFIPEMGIGLYYMYVYML